MKSPPTLTRYSIEELRPGMYIAEILDQSGKVVMSQSGVVRTKAQIAQLGQRGVRAVHVDLARSQLDTDAAEAPEEIRSEKIPLQAQRGEDSKTHIRRLYGEARQLQEKFLAQVSQGEALDIEPLAEIADEMVETMFSHGDAMLCLARIRAKDAYLMEHSMNVAILLANFGRYLGMDRPVLKELTMGGLLHDVGKVMTPDEVLHKPGRLTDAEFDIMREHAMHSRLILRATEGITEIMVEVAANHHERLDGTGYPRKLTAEDLSIHSRMSSIVDVYDALTADRVYKDGMACTQAFRILLEGAGTQFDAELDSKFIKCMSVYPPGTLVKLSNQRLAIVIQRNRKEPLKPLVKVFYHAGRRHYEDVKLLDLSKSSVSESIECSVDPKDFDIKLDAFM